MRTSWWACISVGAGLTCLVAGLVAYQLFDQPSPPAASPGASAQSERSPLDQKPEQPLAAKDESRPPDVDPPPARSEPDQKEARLEDATGAIDRSGQNEPKQNLAWLSYYAYSEYPPETKPADTVLEALKDVPPGTPVEEIRRVAGILGLDFTFMKAIAKIESNFNPKARTGSYIGLFQLSKYEFSRHGSGDILVPRDNTVAAALKMSTEAVLFERYNRRKPNLNDLYLIHQQGIEGATEHLSKPNRLAWRSMCATDEGKQKGEKWCKKAIWGNTLPALKKAWKKVDNITSAAFVEMWQERVTKFYARYSEATGY